MHGAYELTIGGQIYPYKLRRSRRARHVSLHVEVGGDIEVVVPWHVSFALARQFVYERRCWLEQVVPKQIAVGRQIRPRSLQSGEYLPVLGHNFLLKVEQSNQRQRTRTAQQHRLLTVFVRDAHQIRPAVIRWYKDKARQYFERCVGRHAGLANVAVQKIRVADFKSQWGSCQASGQVLAFNWRLLLAPEAVANYVAAHEVAHVRFARHSAKFWQLVSRLDPSFWQQRRWLRRHGHMLVL